MKKNFINFILTMTTIAVVVLLVTLGDRIKSKQAEVIVLCAILLLVSVLYHAYKQHYSDKRESFFVPKINGIGFSVNPNTFEGKIIWYVVFLVVIIFLLVTIFK